VKSIGVTGAFGFLGSNFIAAAIEARSDTRLQSALSKGEYSRIVAFASKTDSNPLFDPSQVEVRSLDLLDYEGMVSSLDGLDAVAHFAGKVDYRRSQKRAVWDADVLGTRLLFDAAK
jgi:nucleoside-diphosphate-sugar epimerase